MALDNIDTRTLEARRKALFERLPLSMAIGVFIALGVVWVLWNHIPREPLLAWLAIRVAVSVTRFWESMRLMRIDVTGLKNEFINYRVLAMIDGVAWGALGWWLTPVENIQVAAVSIGVGLGVAALGVLILHMDLWAASLFITPILLPNSLYALTRTDEFGIFCAAAMGGFLVMLLLEARRSNLRLHELFRLRFQSEQVAQAQAEALRQAQYLSEAKSRFVATMSHEMRTPLHGILGLARLMAERERHPEDTHRLALIRSSGEHLVSVINDVLDFSRMESSGLPIHRQPFDLHALVREVADTQRIAAAEKHLTLVMQFEAETDMDVVGDAVRIRQVLHNLVGNAIKFTQEGGIRLHVARRPGSDEVAIAVHDTGIGIPSTDLARVFEAFHQAEGTYQRRFGGTGLGLTISRELCRAMDSELSCRSEVGRGSEFRFVLPLPAVARCGAQAMTVVAASPVSNAPAADMAKAAQAPSSEAAPGDGPHVLLVEDNPVNVLVAQAQLQQMGVRVSVVNDGLEAVDWMIRQQPDLVLMDCEMPGLDGFEATRRIRAHERAVGRKPVDIVALTANGREVHGDRCRDAGMNGHLAKPFGPDDLARVLMHHLRGGSQVPGRQTAAMQSSGV